MTQSKSVSNEVLEFLRKTDTCTISNAVETFDVRMRNEGYIHNGPKCLFPHLPIVAGYAITGRIRTSVPPVIRNRCYYNTPEWWEYVAGIAGPKVIVLADCDEAPGMGAFFGQMHMEISKALGCIAYVTNGAIRDLAQLKDGKFPCFAGHVSPSHAYAHLIEFGEPIEMGTLKISPGDLLHADCHGVQKIPIEIADQLPERVQQIIARESKLIELCRSSDFSFETLKDVLDAADTFQPFVYRDGMQAKNGNES